MTYKLANGFNGVLRKLDQNGIEFIPDDSENVDWAEYQRWLQAGGEQSGRQPIVLYQ